MIVSFTNPHDPYACPQEDWDLYRHEDIDMPRVRYIPDGEIDAHSRRLRAVYECTPGAVSDEQIRNARHAYYGQISMVDRKIGRLLKTLRETGLADETLVVVTSDHGDMLGERGLWYKMSFYEPSVRVPLIIAGAGVSTATRITSPVSLVDLLPTLLEFAGSTMGGSGAELERGGDGQSLLPALCGRHPDPERPIISEYFAEGAIAPMIMVRRGAHKYIYSRFDAPQLFNLESDPLELENVSGRDELRSLERTLRSLALSHIDYEKLHRDILRSQRRRHLVFAANSRGKVTSWDYQPFVDASVQYMRNQFNLDDVENKARL